MHWLLTSVAAVMTDSRFMSGVMLIYNVMQTDRQYALMIVARISVAQCITALDLQA